MDQEAAELKQHLFETVLGQLLKKVGKQKSDLAKEGKSIGWKVDLAAAMKQQTTVTNRWLGENLHLGNMYEVSRKISDWLRHPEMNSQENSFSPQTPKSDPFSFLHLPFFYIVGGNRP